MVRRAAGGGAADILLEVKAGDDGYNLGRAHLGLTTTDGGHFRFGQFSNAATLFQGMKHHAEIGIGHYARDGGQWWECPSWH